MYFTVKEMAELSHVTIKTLHHYHKIRLLVPFKISEAGYRLYRRYELERLQQILFYRELDFSLEEIKTLLDNESTRQKVLEDQKERLMTRKNRLDQLVSTITKSIAYEKRGKTMKKEDLFRGFTSDAEWKEALLEQDKYLKETYDVQLLDEETIDVTELNENAQEATQFTAEMIKALQSGKKHNDAKVLEVVADHIGYLQENNMLEDATQFVAQTQFFIEDDFHLSMLEGQQIGLSYFLNASAIAYAKSLDV